MNKERRKAIARAGDLIREAIEILEAARDEEQDYYDNMPESIQSGEKGDAASVCVSSLEDGISNAEEAASACDDAGAQ